MKRINSGENVLIRRNLEKADGTVLLLSSLSTFTAEVMQNGSVIETLTYPSARLRQGTTTSQAEVEINTTTSNKFKRGRVSIRWTLVAANALFTSETTQKDIIIEDILDVV